MPTRRRAGAVAAGVRPAARTVLREAGIGAPLVPVPDGYRTSGVAPVGGGHVVLVVRFCRGVVPLQPDGSRRSAADGECGTATGGPQRVRPVCSLTLPSGGTRRRDVL